MNGKPVCRLGVLLSGRGSNFLAIQSAIEAGRLPRAEIAVVISNHAEAPGLQAARERNLTAVALEKSDYPSREARDTAIGEILKVHRVDLLILAGYDRILGNPVLERYAGRILNIHPSLLPAYGGKGMVGLRVHQAVLANQEAESGCSVHGVTADVDGGPILGQARVPVYPDDTPEALAARILEQEHRLYPAVIRQFIETHWNPSESVDCHEQNLSV